MSVDMDPDCCYLCKYCKELNVGHSTGLLYQCDKYRCIVNDVTKRVCTEQGWDSMNKSSQPKSNIVKFKINNYDERSKIVSILGMNGYKVWVESNEDDIIALKYSSYVCVEMPGTKDETKN